MPSKTRVEKKNLDIYGHKPLAWSRARRQLIAATKGKHRSTNGSHWLATTSPGGKPHITGVGAVWVDDRFYIVSGPRTRKSRNLALNPKCTISVSLPDLDLVVDGSARRVTDSKTLKRLVKVYNATGWPARVERDAFTAEYSAPTAGRPPWYLYVMTPTVAVAVTTKKPYGATRWRFKAAR